MENNKKTANFWILSTALLLISIIALYEYFVKGNVNYLQLTLVFALSPNLFKEVPSLDK